jgi:hypothetical protein
MDPVSSIAGAVGSVANLVEGILSREEKNFPNSEAENEDEQIRAAFASRNVDRQWELACKLFGNVGLLWPRPESVEESERQFKFAALRCASQLHRERRLATAAFHKLTTR